MGCIASHNNSASFDSSYVAETVIGEAHTNALLDMQKCDIRKIPDAARAAVNAAINEANKTCINPEILEARVLSVEPTECRTWNAGFQAKAEVKFRCAH
jgi:hypothetical protein